MTESTTTAITFRFASGHILSLDENQIEKIPYLAAIVSSGDHFDSVRDEDGHYKLDSYIEFTQFSFVLESLSFHSVRQLFTCLPKQNEIIPIIALLDFLGIGPQPDPTLNEVDSIFFSTLVYSPMFEKHLQIVRLSVIQDMAVRFAIAMAKEGYDFTKHKVIDQIYWFIMFVLSAHKLFGSRLRHHIYKIAEHCFSLFKPSLLKTLKKLIDRTEKNAKKLILIPNKENVDPDGENKHFLEHQFNLGHFQSSDEFVVFWGPTLEQQEEFLFQRYRNRHWLKYQRIHREDELLEPVYKRVLEFMYGRLQSEICQRAIAEIRGRKSAHKFLPERIYRWLIVRMNEREVLPKEIDDIFERELVQEEIREHILEEICNLILTLEKRRVELSEEIREYKQRSETSSRNEFRSFYILLSDILLEFMQREALSLELILDKLHRNSSIIEQIHRRVLDALYRIALKQFNQWENTQRDIDELHHQLILCQSPEKSPSNTSKLIHQHHRIPVNKPLSKHQFNYFKSNYVYSRTHK